MSENYTEVKTPFQNPLWNFDETPVLEGVYVEKKEIAGGYATSQFVLRTADGKKVAVWASFQLNQLMNEVEQNTKVKIEFTGRTEIGKTEDGEVKSVKNFKVFVA